MSNIFSEDFREFIDLLNKWKVEYMVVGGYAVILHGYRRTTGDLDVWVNRTFGNHQKLIHAMKDFGLTITDINKENFLESNEIDIFSYGRPPVSIDIMNRVKGVNFAEAYQTSQTVEAAGLVIRFIGLDELIKAKKASGRFKDLADIDKLTTKE